MACPNAHRGVGMSVIASPLRAWQSRVLGAAFRVPGRRLRPLPGRSIPKGLPRPAPGAPPKATAGSRDGAYRAMPRHSCRGGNSSAHAAHRGVGMSVIASPLRAWQSRRLRPRPISKCHVPGEVATGSAAKPSQGQRAAARTSAVIASPLRAWQSRVLGAAFRAAGRRLRPLPGRSIPKGLPRPAPGAPQRQPQAAGTGPIAPCPGIHDGVGTAPRMPRIGASA